MIYSDDYFDKLPDDLVEAGKDLCETFLSFFSSLNKNKEIEHYNDIINAYAAFEAYLISKGVSISEIVFKGGKLAIIDVIHTQFNAHLKQFDAKMSLNEIESARVKFRAKFDVGFSYEFSDGDLELIQKLVNELRDHVNKSKVFTAEHKQRILKKLEKLQGELHKKVSSLDMFWGLIGEAGVAMGKFGNDVKPFVDRVSEITNIVWRTQARAEELPSDTTLPLLSSGEEIEE